MARKENGEVYLWGYDGYGQISTAPSNLDDFEKIFVGWCTMAAIDSDGYITVWGADDWDQITDAPTDDGYIFVNFTRRNGISMKSDGTITVWGDDTYGQVSDTPTDIKDIIRVATGHRFFLAMRSDRSLIA